MTPSTRCGYYAAMAQEKQEGRPKRVGLSSVRIDVLEKALELACGDEERITVLSREEVLVR